MKEYLILTLTVTWPFALLALPSLAAAVCWILTRRRHSPHSPHLPH